MSSRAMQRHSEGIDDGKAPLEESTESCGPDRCRRKYDYEAYHEVKRNLGRLVTLGQLRPAMELCLELMKQGSY